MNPARSPADRGAGLPPERDRGFCRLGRDHFHARFLLFRYLPVPVTVPPVLPPAMKMSTAPSVSSQISDRSSVMGVRIGRIHKLPEDDCILHLFLQLFGFSMAPFMPLRPPSARSARRIPAGALRSMLMVSGITKMVLYPFDAATDASPIPVLPLVGSMSVAPGRNRPFSSASSIMLSAARSFTLPAGLKYSSFTRTLAFRSRSCPDSSLPGAASCRSAQLRFHISSYLHSPLFTLWLFLLFLIRNRPDYNFR